MSIVEINWSPSRRQLRQFAICCLFVLPLLGWFWGAGDKALSWLAISGIVIAVAGVAVPEMIKPIFLGLTFITIPMGVVFGELFMLLVYFGVFVPIGMVFRMRKRDALQLQIDRKASTYWQAKKQPRSVKSYFLQS